MMQFGLLERTGERRRIIAHFADTGGRSSPAGWGEHHFHFLSRRLSLAGGFEEEV
ncbi:MAG: hypothetical protein WB774_22880 [Xanthobacteraceae bacterium]|jgi:hypothetical protein